MSEYKGKYKYPCGCYGYKTNLCIATSPYSEPKCPCSLYWEETDCSYGQMEKWRDHLEECKNDQE